MLGGRAGFEKWLKDTDFGKNPMSVSIPRTIGEARVDNWYPVSISAWFGVAYFTLSVEVINTPISGNGSAWGIGVGYIGAVGGIDIFGPTSLLSKVDTFVIAAGSGGPGAGGITFYHGGTHVATAVFGGSGLGAGIGGGGSFTFQ